MNFKPGAGSSRAILIAGALLLGSLFVLAPLAARARSRGVGAEAARVPAEPVAPGPALLKAEGSTAARAAPLFDAEPAPAERSAPAAGREDGEKEHRARYRALLAADPGALEREAPSIVLGEASVAERVGLLRALEDAGSPAATPMLTLALLGNPPAGQSGPVQDYALRNLARRAPGDAAARAALRQSIWGPRASTDGALRRRAAGHLAATATEDELAAGFPELAGEPDPLVAQAIQGALAERARCDPTTSSP